MFLARVVLLNTALTLILPLALHSELDFKEHLKSIVQFLLVLFLILVAGMWKMELLNHV